jgi:hypothetical protein
MYNTFIKLIKIFRNMYTESSLAAAEIAKIFGSELLGVQEKSRMDSGTQPQILKMHPKQFLGATQQHQAQTRIEEQKMLAQLQREAEASHPIPLESTGQPTAPSPSIAAPSPQIQQPQSSASFVVPTDGRGSNIDVWEKINNNLERIANSLERVDITVKKKRVKRTKPTIVQ